MIKRLNTGNSDAKPISYSFNLLSRVFFIFIAILLCILPVLWTLLASFNIIPESIKFHPVLTYNPTIKPYMEIGITEPQFKTELLISFALSTLTTMLSLAIAYLAAYGIVRSDMKGKNVLVQSFLVLACLPVISYIMPLRKLLFVLHLYETFVGVVLAETAIYAPLAAFILYNYLKQVSTELEDSALIEGATTLQILRRIVFPITAQGVAATAIIIFVLSWNQVIIPLILAPPKSTVPVAMLDFFIMEREVEWPVAAAALIVSLSPIVVFVAAAYKVLAVFTIQVDNDFT